jgi:hypothetical protein
MYAAVGVTPLRSISSWRDRGRWRPKELNVEALGDDDRRPHGMPSRKYVAV